ncbi:MAG: M13 family metallopeptidase [Bacteroidales bacterium]|nr:M13 family metallopeptidase [Bacteroidales bacterium]
MKRTLKNLIMILTLAGIGLSGCNNADNNNDKKQLDSIPGFAMSNFDTTYKPCDNFFRYATGGWQKANPIPKTEGRWGSFNILAEHNEDKIKGIILDAAAQKTKKGNVVQQIGDLYKSAMDSTGIEKKGLLPLKPFLEKIDNLKDCKEFPDFFAANKLGGLGNFFSTTVGVDEKDVTRYVMYLDQGGLTLPDRDYYLVDNERYQKIRKTYTDYLIKMFVLMGDDNSQAEAEAQSVMEIETQLAEFSMSRVDMRLPEKTYNRMSVVELQLLVPNFNFSQYFSTLHIQLDTVVVRQKDFFAKMNVLLTDVPIEKWKTYFKFHILNGYASWLSSDFVETKFNFFSGTLSGVTEMKSRQKRSVRLINNIFAKPLGKLFVEKYFPESSKKTVESMIEDLRSVYIERIQQLDWMSDETKQKAVEKLHAFTYKIGYPDKWKDYSAIDIVPNDLIHNMLAIYKFQVKDNLDKLGKPVDRKEWGMPPQMVNAYYDPSMNEVVFPAGILQAPFFDPNADICINYGGIVGVIGHEFTHGFDDQGSKYDKIGNLNPWWNAEDAKKFAEKTQVIVDQFNGYEPYPGIHVVGKLTLGENIADLGGLTLSYYAMQKHFKEVGRSNDIAGFTPEQRYFLGWAQVWASNIRDELGKQLITVDPHSPAQYRVNGPMSNMTEFREAWHCKLGDNMVRTDSLQAKIW